MKILPAIDSLPLLKQIAQMVMVRASGHLYDRQIRYPQWEATNSVLQDWLQNWGVGGVIVMGGSAIEISRRSLQFQAWAEIPLLMAADVEEGVGQRFEGATWFNPPFASSILEPEMAAEMGRITAIEASEIGINWLFAPVADVNNNPKNPVINVRAFGDRCQIVAERVSAFIRGAKSYPVLTTAKHFPGHGDTDVDSHLHLPILHHHRDRFDSLELIPFQAAIEAGVDSVMSAHVLAPALDSQEIATLSAPILTALLRKELGFEGLIVTDALMMAGVAQRYDGSEVAVRAVQAGADVLLMPIDPVETIQAIYTAVERGEISGDRIRSSVARIWQAKQKVCLTKSQKEDSIPQVGEAQSWLMAEDMQRRSQRLYIPASFLDNFPGNSAGSKEETIKSDFTNLIVVDQVLSASEFLQDNLGAIAIPKTLGGKTLIVDRDSIGHLKIEELGSIFLQIFSRGNPFRGSADLHGQMKEMVRSLVKEKNLMAIAVYGSPYGLDQLLPLIPKSIPWAFSYGQQPYAQELILRELFAQQLK